MFDIIFSALKSNDCICIYIYKIGNKILENFCVTYEETNKVKYYNSNLIFCDYELFYMLPQELIFDMYYNL